MCPDSMVIALGGNALDSDSGSPDLSSLKRARRHLSRQVERGLVITHGNGPQIGMLAQAGREDPNLSLDVMGAEVEGWLGYLVEQELGNLLNDHRAVVSLLTRVEVDGSDEAFDTPSKPIGQWLSAATARQLQHRYGWTFVEENSRFRRLVPSPVPRNILQDDAIRQLLANRFVVVCAGGGGIPVVRRPDNTLEGVEAVIDKDLASSLLAVQLQAGMLILATNVDGVYQNWQCGNQHLISSISADGLRSLDLPAGSMGPKAEAACHFVDATGGTAIIGNFDALSQLMEQQAGTRVTPGG